jgi:hypothetical protein
MKKILLVLIAVAFVSSLCFAAEPQATADEAKTFTGKIESIAKVMGKPPKWLYAILTVVADSGEKIIIYVPKATAVIDISGNDMAEGGKKFGALLLKKGERVEVKYATGTLMIKSRNEGLSIRCLD